MAPLVVAAVVVQARRPQQELERVVPARPADAAWWRHLPGRGPAAGVAAARPSDRWSA